MNPQTKKGLIIGGSILGVVLIGTGIGLGVYYGTRDTNNGVQVWGYDDQVSSTSLKVNKYMDLTFTEMANYWGDGSLDSKHAGVASAEKTLKKNSHYHSVEDDIEILDGVHGSSQGLGYLSSTWVAGYDDGEQFKMLELYDNASTDGDRSNADNYLDPLSDDDKVNYSNVTSKDKEIDGDYVEDDDENIGEGKYDIYPESMQAVLNASLKVSVDVANSIRAAGVLGTNNPLTIDALGEDYVNWLREENDFVDDFVISYGLFNYMAYDSSNIENINESAIAGSSESGVGEFKFSSLQTSYENLMGDDTVNLLDDVLEQQDSTSDAYHIKVDGTGTNSGIMKNEIANFQKDLDSQVTNSGVKFQYDLVNGGSGEAWKVSQDYIPGTESDSKADGRADAFIGTASRASKPEEVHNFGYDADSSSLPTKDGSGDIYTVPGESEDGQILGVTMGIDLPVFFVNEGMTFDYTVKEDSINNIINAEEKGVKVGDKVKVTPVGMSDKGGKDIYENQMSWSEALDEGGFIVEIV